VVEAAAAEGGDLRVTERGDQCLAYAKGIDRIAGVLAAAGASDAALALQERAVVGSARANANRLANADHANLVRAGRAAHEQLEAVRRLLAQDPKARVLALSAHEDTAHPRRVMQAGALGYLNKRSAPDALIAAVTSVAASRPYVDAQTAQVLALAQVKGDANPAETLSEREFSVFLQLAKGLSVAQIAANLNLSPSTVGTHLYHVKQKLGAGNQSELTLVALRWGLIEI
jgi:two-component system invasion response regulator UvrY